MGKYTTLKALFTAIANSLRSKTGSTGTIVADDFPSVIDSLSTGGITPTGTKTINTNGSHDVTNYATAQVAVPVGVTPSGNKTITENGTYDVASYANAIVNVPTGMNAKVFATTVASNVTSGNYEILPANEYLKSIRNDPNAFVLLLPMNQQPSTAMYSLWIIANFTLAYTGTVQRKGLLVRTTASANNVTGSNYGVPGTNGSGHISVESDGSILIRGCNTTYPVIAGEYRIIAGILA